MDSHISKHEQSHNEIVIDQLLSGLDQIPYHDHVAKVRFDHYRMTPYQEIDDPIALMNQIQEVQRLVRLARNQHANATDNDPIVRLDQFHVDSISGRDRILLHASTTQYNYQVSIIGSSAELFFSIQQSSIGLRGVAQTTDDPNSSLYYQNHSTHGTNDFIDYSVTASLQ